MLSVFFACIGALVATTILVCVVASVAIGCLQPYDLFDEEIRSRLRATPSPTTLLESLHRFIRLLQTKALIGAISLPVKAAEERLTPAGTRMLIKTVLTLTASKSSPDPAPAPARGQDIWASLTTKQPSTEDHTAQREKLWASMFSAAPGAMPTSTSTSSTDTDAKPTTRRIRRPVVQ